MYHTLVSMTSGQFAGLHQLKAVTGLTMTEWLRRMYDYCSRPEVLNELHPPLSGRLVLR